MQTLAAVVVSILVIVAGGEIVARMVVRSVYDILEQWDKAKARRAAGYPEDSEIN